MAIHEKQMMLGRQTKNAELAAFNASQTSPASDDKTEIRRQFHREFFGSL